MSTFAQLGSLMCSSILTALLFVFWEGLGHAQEEQVITVGIAADVRGLDPARINFASEYQVGINLYSGLVRLKTGTGILEPDLAERWEVSSDGKVYTFHLRKGVQFHKGFGEVTAEDVVFTFRRHMDPVTKSVYSGDFEGIKSVEAVNKYTVRLNFAKPAPAWLRATAAYRPGLIVSKKAVTQQGENFNLNPIGSGPFKLEEYFRGTRIVLTANDSYYSGAPKLRKVTFIPIPDETVAQLALESGKIDMFYARTGESIAQFKGKRGFVVQEAPQFGMRSLWLNTRRKPLDNLKVRQAIAYALDKGPILSVLGGTGALADNSLPPGFLGYTEKITRYPHDPGKAKRLLAEAGFPNGIKSSLLYASIAGYREVIPILQAQWAEAGIQVDLLPREGGTARSMMEQGNYDIAFQGLGRPPDPDIILSHGFHTSNYPPGPNLSFYSGVDELLDKARSTMNEKIRADLYEQIQRKITADVPVIPIYYPNMIMIAADYVKGHVVGRLNDFWMYTTYIKKLK
jgi:ABC-type transport system substrate-binding protein